jgi:hypothetical protein
MRVVNSERNRWFGRVADMKEKRNEYVVVGGKFDCKQLCGRFRRIWKDDIKMILKRTGGISWIYLAQGRDIRWDNLNMVMILLFP